MREQALLGFGFVRRGLARAQPRLRDEVLERFSKLDQPSYTGFVMPKLTATRDAEGTITAVQISYPLEETQMLEWSGRR